MSKRIKVRALKSSTALSKSPKKVAKVLDVKVQPPKVEPIHAVDPLMEIANLPQQFAEASGEVILAEPKVEEKGPKDVFSIDRTGSMFPWSHQAKLWEMAEVNTRFILRFLESFTRARSPNDLLAITAAFSKEGTMLLEQHSNTMLKILVGQPVH